MSGGLCSNGWARRSPASTSASTRSFESALGTTKKPSSANERRCSGVRRTNSNAKLLLSCQDAAMLHLVIRRGQNRSLGKQLLHVVNRIEHVTRHLMLRLAGLDIVSLYVDVFAVNQHAPLRIPSLVCGRDNVDIRILLNPDFFQPV